MTGRSAAFLVMKIGLLAVVMLFAFAITANIAGLEVASQPSEPTGLIAMILLGVCLVNTVVLAYPILRSRWHGPKLVATICLVYFGAETFMSQIETAFFAGALNIPADVMRGIVLSGFLRALCFSPLAVLVLGRMRTRQPKEEVNTRLIMPRRGWVWRLALLPVMYVCLYFLFGYYIAWQSPEVRQLYTGSTNMKPFFDHMLDVVRDTPQIIPFQWFRGLLWLGLALPIIQMMRGTQWETALAVGLLFGVLLTSGLMLPNPYMSGPVRLAHFIETSTSTFIYGSLIGWLFSRRQSSDISHGRMVFRP